ncbi:MAG: argininosuccinate lyase [Acidimicrobiia bacterium]|nr:argininosuccinate lyase [Acidimicrobiia bacterium]
MTSPTDGSPLWAGRFTADPATALWDFSVDLDVERELLPHDIAVNRAHADMLHACGLLSDADHDAISDALDRIRSELEAGSFAFSHQDEDIHMAIERRLGELCGDAGGRIHAARSRNDQVATDFGLWCREAALRLAVAVDGLGLVLCDHAAQHADTLAPGYTHLQRAQPTTLGHVLSAHAAALDRDAERLVGARDRNDTCPLGAGALATTTLPIDPAATAAALGFARPFLNSMDAVASRDFAMDLLAASTICATTLSRLAEDVVLWSSEEFGIVHLDDAWATGSSMMPQKKNPDVAELARALPGRVLGAFVSLTTIVKGLPLAYNRDLQEDKAATFAALRRLELGLVAMRGLIATAEFDVARLESAAAGGSAAATDLAEALVAVGVPFRGAHEMVGGLVGDLVQQGRSLGSVTVEELTAVHPALSACAGEWLSARACVERRRVPGGPHPDAVRGAVAILRERIAARAERLPA